MKKWVVLMVVMLMVAGVQAKEKGPKGPTTKDQFVAAQQKRAEKAGKEFDQAKAEALFAKMDKNGDGVLTADEMVRAPKKGKKAASSDEGSGEE